MSDIYFNEDHYHRFARTTLPKQVLAESKNAWTKNSNDFTARKDKQKIVPFKTTKSILTSVSDSYISYKNRAKTARFPIVSPSNENEENGRTSRIQQRRPSRTLTAREDSNISKRRPVSSLRQQSIELGSDPERHLSYRYERPKTSAQRPTKTADEESSRRPHTSSCQRLRPSSRKGPGLTYRIRNDLPPSSEKLKEGEVEIKLQVKDIDIVEPEETDLVSALSDKVLALYNHVTSSEQKYIARLNENTSVEGLIYKKIKIGSVLLIAECQTLEALDKLEGMYISEELNSILNDTFISPELLDELGVKKLSLNTTIRQRSIEKCRDDLLIKEYIDDTQQYEEEEVFISRVDCVHKLQKLWDNFRSQQTTITNQYNHFLSYINDFFMVLKLCKPVSLKNFACIEDVTLCYNFLLRSQSIGKSVRIDLVKEFLEIIHQIKQIIKSTFVEFCQWEKHLLKYITPESLGQLKKSFQNINMMLSPKKKFDTLNFFAVLKVNVLDRQIFGGLIKYIPALFAAFSVVEGELGTLKGLLAYERERETKTENNPVEKRPSSNENQSYNPKPDPVDALVENILIEAQKQVRFLIKRPSKEKMESAKQDTSEKENGKEENGTQEIKSVPAETDNREIFKSQEANQETENRQLKSATDASSTETCSSRSLKLKDSTKMKFSSYMGLISKLKSEQEQYESSEYRYGKDSPRKDGKTVFLVISGRSISVNKPESNNPDETKKPTQTFKKQFSKSSMRSTNSTDSNDKAEISAPEKNGSRNSDTWSVTSSVGSTDINPCLYDITDEEYRAKITDRGKGSNREHVPNGFVQPLPKRRGMEVPKKLPSPRQNTNEQKYQNCQEIAIVLDSSEITTPTSQLLELPPISNSFEKRPAPLDVDNMTHNSIEIIPENDTTSTAESCEDLFESLTPEELEKSFEEVTTPPIIINEIADDDCGSLSKSFDTVLYSNRKPIYARRHRLSDFSLDGFGLNAPSNTPNSSMVFNSNSLVPRTEARHRLSVSRRSSMEPQSSESARSSPVRTPHPKSPELSALVVTPQQLVSGRSSASPQLLSSRSSVCVTPNSPRSVETRPKSNISSANRQRVVWMASSLNNRLSLHPRERINHNTTTLKSAFTERYRDKYFNEIIKPCKRTVRFRTPSPRSRSFSARGPMRADLKSAQLYSRSDLDTKLYSRPHTVHNTRSKGRQGQSQTNAVSHIPDENETSARSNSGRVISRKEQEAKRANSVRHRGYSSGSRTNITSDDEYIGYSTHLKVVIRKDSTSKKLSKNVDNQKYEYASVSNLANAVSQN